MPMSNKRKKQLAVARELKRVRSLNLTEAQTDRVDSNSWPLLLSTEGDSVSESDTGSESDNSAASSEEEDDDRPGCDHEIELKWRRGAERHLRGGYGAGSRSSERNERERLNGLGKAARESYNLAALWKRQEEIQQEILARPLLQGI